MNLLRELAGNVDNVSGSCSILAVDEETGLVAVNQSVTSSSISFLEPSSLRRIYRIKVPWAVASDISDAVRQIVSGTVDRKPGFRSDSLAGLITSMHIWSAKSILLCQVSECPDIRILSMLTGDFLTELKGHIQPISCLMSYRKEDILFSGSADGSIRVWRASDCILHAHAATGALDNTSLNELEKKVAQMPVGRPLGSGSRMAVRSLLTRLQSILNLSPRWRQCIISGFYDGKKYRSDGSSIPVDSLGIEVSFKLYA